jgi:hypothetical protein
MLRRLAAIGSVLVFASAGWAADEGVYIEQEMNQAAVGRMPAMSGVQKIWMTATNVRNEAEFGDTTSVAIIDLVNRKIVLMPTEDKQYIEMGLDDYQKIVGMRLKSSGLQDETANPKLTPTVEQKKIGEWNCVKYVFEQGGRVPVRSELWVSKETGVDFSAYMDLMKKMGMDQALGKLSQFVTAIDGYPVEVTTEQTVESQKISSTTRVRKVVRGPVDPSLFKIPAGYKRLGGNTGVKK